MKKIVIKELSIFIENKFGELGSAVSVLKENRISIKSIMLADSSEFAILRVITSNQRKAKAVLENAGYMVKISEVFGIKIKNTIGSFLEVINILATKKIEIRYTYTVNEEDEGIFIIKTKEDSLKEAQKLLLENGVELLSSI